MLTVLVRNKRKIKLLYSVMSTGKTEGIGHTE